jgi:rhodanese-related sulfurtransferase
MNFFKLIKSMFQSVPRLDPAACAERVRSGEAVLVDVREPGEWTSGVAESAVLLPLSDLTGSRTQWEKFLAENRGREILLYCHAGGRSGMAARILAAEGHRAADTGSLRDWLGAGWPVAKPPTARGKSR